MLVIGTAGHVDHGKSTLVRALTGIDPDRLAEEKKREMTIDLGFAWLNLDGHEDEIGVIDVPGHRDFIDNMLAGVGGIDLALFVIAADEGVMPQTREHLAILNLLETKNGVVVLTKIDMVDDDDWIELVTMEIEETLAGTALAGAPILPVSAHTGAGIDELKRALAEALVSAEPKIDIGRPRLPVDRVFTLSGFGTVVTGTLTGGRLRLGDAIELQPSGLSGRIRGLQTHKTKLEVARPGSRVAVNISGVEKRQVKRGMVLAPPDTVRPTLLVDVQYNHLADADAPLKHNMEVKFFTNSAETVARVRVIGDKQILPGASGWLQVALGRPLAVMRGDRYILRRPSPGATIGGGKVLDPFPGRRHRRFRDDVVTRFKTMAEGTPADLLLQQIRRLEPARPNDLRKQSRLAEADFEALVAELQDGGDVAIIGKLIVSRPTLQTWRNQAEALVRSYHDDHPLRIGIPREEVRSQLRMKAAPFLDMINGMQADEILRQRGAWLHLSEHEVRFDAAQQAKIAALTARFEGSGINSPSVKEAKAAVGDAVFEALLQLGRFVAVNRDVVWLPNDYEKFTLAVYNYLRQNETISVSQARDLFSTSRKYIIALLEHLDDKRVTRRRDDARGLNQPTADNFFNDLSN